MENINPVVSLNLEHQLPKDVAVKELAGQVFKDVLSSLVTDTEDNDFKTDEEKEVSSGANSILSANSEQFVDYFLKSVQGKQILDDFYKKHQESADINSRGNSRIVSEEIR
jgi:hypothetical protein